MAQGCGATIYAAGPGTVITAGPYQGYGNAVRIDHGDDLVTLYGHMQWSSLRVTRRPDRSTRARRSAPKATPASRSAATSTSKSSKSGTPVDPEPFMAALGLPLK